MQVSQSVGISLPVSVLKRIDSERGDIPRSRFLLRILQKLSHDDVGTYREAYRELRDKDSIDQEIKFYNRPNL
jgi:hypothetical protein